MNCGTWGGFWGYSFFPWSFIWMALHLAVLVLVVWAAVLVIKHFTGPKAVMRG